MNSLIAANLKHHPGRTLASVAGVAVGVLLVVLTVGLVRGMLRERGRRETNTGVEILLSQGSQGGISWTTMSVSLPVAQLAQVRAVPGVRAATPVAQHLEFGGTGALGLRQVDGVDFADYQRTTGVRIIEGHPLPTAGDVMIVDPKFAAAHQTKLGDKVHLLERDFIIIGIYAPETGARMMVPLRTLQEALGAPEMCSMFLVKCENGQEQEAVAQRIVERLPELRVLFTRDLPRLFATGFAAFNVFLHAVAALAATISLLIVLLVTYTTVTERTRQIGILKALGASRRFIAWVFIKESLALSALGVMSGLLSALAVRLVLVTGMGMTLEIQAGTALAAALGGLLCGALGAFYPSWRAASLDAVEALSYE
jgi:putative ABC transport system permease protein